MTPSTYTLDDNKRKLLNEKILNEELLETLLYSYSKYAKIERDEIYKLRGEFNKRYLGRDENGKRRPFIKPAVLTKMYENSKEYKKAKPKNTKMREYYDNKEFLIHKFLKPKLIHYIETKYIDKATSAPQLKYFAYYETTNGSYHLPINGPIDGLELVKLPELLVSAESSSELPPIEHCDELMEYIKRHINEIKFKGASTR